MQIEWKAPERTIYYSDKVAGYGMVKSIRRLNADRSSLVSVSVVADLDPEGNPPVNPAYYLNVGTAVLVLGGGDGQSVAVTDSDVHDPSGEVVTAINAGNVSEPQLVGLLNQFHDGIADLFGTV